MREIKLFLIVATLAIYMATVFVLYNNGLNWPAVFFGDILSIDWRSQFNIDFLIHLILFATWISWREGFSNKGIVFGILSIFMGGMFGFPYVLYAIYKANGNAKKVLLGVHA